MIELKLAIGSEEWIKAKKSTIGSSDISTILGLNKFTTPLQLWCSKTGRLPDTEPNDYMRIGMHLEPVVAGIFQRREGKPVMYVGKSYRHTTIEWATASPDYWILDEHESPKGVLECKTTSHYNESSWVDKIPNHAHTQAIWQMGVTGRKEESWTACLCGADPNKFYAHLVEWDESIWNAMIEAAAKFLDFVKKDVPPDAKAADIKLLESLAPKIESEIELSSEAGELLRAYEDITGGMELAKDTLKLMQEKADNIRAKLVQMMAGHSSARFDNWILSNKRVQRKEHVVHASSYDRFTIKTLKGDK